MILKKIFGSNCDTCKKSLKKEKIDSLEKLSDYSEKEILQLHGFRKKYINEAERLYERASDVK
jgi:DNA-directed RNA polymerase alpha subunit